MYKIMLTNIKTVLYKEHTLRKIYILRQYKWQEFAKLQRSKHTRLVEKLYKRSIITFLVLLPSHWTLSKFLLCFYTIFFLMPNFKTSFTYKLFNSMGKPTHLPIMRYINLITKLGPELGVRKFLIVCRFCCLS